MPVFSPFNSSDKEKFAEKANIFAAKLKSLGLGSDEESVNSDDDAKFSDDSQGGGKPTAVDTLLRHPAGTTWIKIDDTTCGSRCLYTMTDGTRVQCVCGKKKEECSSVSHQRSSNQVPHGFYIEAPVANEKYAPAGFLKPGCASKNSEAVNANSSEEEPSDDEHVGITPSDEDASPYEEGYPQGSDQLHGSQNRRVQS